MAEPTSAPPDLRRLHKDAGLSLAQALVLVNDRAPGTFGCRSALLRVEQRGTQKVSVIRALAAAYGVPFDTVADAADNSLSFSRQCVDNWSTVMRQ